MNNNRKGNMSFATYIRLGNSTWSVEDSLPLVHKHKNDIWVDVYYEARILEVNDDGVLIEEVPIIRNWGIQDWVDDQIKKDILLEISDHYGSTDGIKDDFNESRDEKEYSSKYYSPEDAMEYFGFDAEDVGLEEDDEEMEEELIDDEEPFESYSDEKIDRLAKLLNSMETDNSSAEASTNALNESREQNKVTGGRPLHHLLNFIHNVSELEGTYVSNPLKPGFQVLMMTGTKSDLASRLPLTGIFTIDGDRPVIELAFITEGTKIPAVIQRKPVELEEKLRNFYQITSDNLANFDELGKIEQVEAFLDDSGISAFRFRLQGNINSQLDYRQDEVLQEHLLLNIIKAFQDQQVLLEVNLIADE